MTDAAPEVLVRYETPTPSIAKITLSRPKQRNAQNARLLYALNDAFDRAAQDNTVRVVILAGAGVDFSTGHDLKGNQAEMQAVAEELGGVTPWGGYTEDGAHGFYAFEQEVFLGLTRRWRNMPKPTIAQVQGNCIAAGLMLAWACDIIIAADNAVFSDPVVTFGMPGVEWFAHPYELGPRKAKEFLFTSDKWNAVEAHRLGMVNHVVPLAELEASVIAMAEKIASKPMFALKLAKEAVNRAEDMGGKTQAIDAFLSLHHLAHQHNNLLFGSLMDPKSVPIRAGQPKTGA